MSTVQSSTQLGRWVEYACETLGLGLFMISAGIFGTLLEAPSYRAYEVVPDPLHRRMLMGLAMGLTAIALVYSPWGRRSGAHNNPCVTLTFWALGRIKGCDVLGYITAQFLGAVLGTVVVAMLLGEAFVMRPVLAVTTIPGPLGVGSALVAEICISFLLIISVLFMSHGGAKAWTGVLAGILVALFIMVESPLSGMSMNPARTLGSALVGGIYDGLWLYFVAPPLGMLGAAWLFSRVIVHHHGCAKMYHCQRVRCLFCGHEPESRNLSAD